MQNVIAGTFNHVTKCDRCRPDEEGTTKIRVNRTVIFLSRFILVLVYKASPKKYARFWPKFWTKILIKNRHFGQTCLNI